MKQKYYSFIFRKDNKFFECQSFRDTDYYSAKLQAEVYADKLRYYNNGIIKVTREYNR